MVSDHDDRFKTYKKTDFKHSLHDDARAGLSDFIAHHCSGLAIV